MEWIKEVLFNENNPSNQDDIVTKLLEVPVEAMMEELGLNQNCLQSITARNIPQFSNINDVETVVKIVSDCMDSSMIDYQYVGYLINKNSNVGAQRKYGENHLKLAIMLGLVTEKPYFITPLGKGFLNLSQEDQIILRTKLSLRIPIIQHILLDSREATVDGMSYLNDTLSGSTAIRRRSNVKQLILNIYEISGMEIKKQILDHIKWG